MVDPFAVFGIEPVFDVDIEDLERRHRELSRALHPDRHAGQAAGARRQALGKAIEVNDAWRVLHDPIQRATAVLAKSGVEFSETSQPQLDPEFLMDTMELREELADARRAKNLPKVRALRDQVAASEQATLREVSHAIATLQRGSAETAAAPTADNALRALGKLRYFRRFLEEVAAIEDELG